MTVLVLTEQVDPTADQVLDLLNQRGVPVLRADTSWFPQQMDVTGELDNGVWTGQLRTHHRRVDLGEIRSIWYRHPTGFVFPESMSAPERRHAAYEAKFGSAGSCGRCRRCGSTTRLGRPTCTSRPSSRPPHAAG